jgi:transmembrane 9 superfamily protein 2/4
MILISFISIVIFVQPILPFYIPGVAPLDFEKGENVEVKAVKMTSTKTQLPYDYYDLAVHCKPSNGTKYKSENLGNKQRKIYYENQFIRFYLGEILRGDRIVNTKYKVK